MHHEQLNNQVNERLNKQLNQANLSQHKANNIKLTRVLNH
ncbi:Uncharacterised protein [Mycobacteroides abscessus subsp. abscessus]|nr:Uncharacterised protein [Mycobacteroides abscessus subsp. abscessus]